jgi:hypothetical protein
MVGALLVWALSLSSIDLYGLDDYGLTLHLPAGWYVALVVCVVGTVWNACTNSTRWAWAYLLGVVVVLFATVPLLAEQPHYSWSYKHIGVVRFLAEHGQVDRSIDIYNRWPGFFAVNAVFGRAAGLPNPVVYAAWSEVFFTAFNLLLVGNIVRALTGSRQIAVVAGLFFVAFNWVGQMYFSPQALTYSLHLVILWLVVTQLRRDTPGRVGRKILDLAARIVRRPQDPWTSTGHRWMPAWMAVTAIVLIDAAVVTSHQLSPYMVVLEVGGLTLIGFVRTRLLAVGLLALALAFLAPNLGYVKDNRLFSSSDPLSNVERSAPSKARAAANDVGPKAGKVWNERAGGTLVIIMLGGTAMATFVLARRGHGARALVLLTLALAPFALVFGATYGSEAVLRVMLFSSPWCAALVAWALMGVRRRGLRAGLVAGLAVASSALFVAAAFGQEELHSISLDEVRASDYLYANGTTPAVIMTADTGFPRRYGPRYPDFRGPGGEDFDPSLMSLGSFRHRSLGAADVPHIVEIIQKYAARGYLVFSATQTTHADIFRLAPPGALEDLEAAEARSPRFRLFYSGSSTRIYELPPSSEMPAGPVAPAEPNESELRALRELAERDARTKAARKAQARQAAQRAAARRAAARRAAARRAAARRARARRRAAPPAPPAVRPPVARPFVAPRPPVAPLPPAVSPRPAPPPPPPPGDTFDDSG